MHNPAVLISSWDLARTDALIFTFADYIPSFIKDRSSVRFTKYNFPYFDLKGKRHKFIWLWYLAHILSLGTFETQFRCRGHFQAGFGEDWWRVERNQLLVQGTWLYLSINKALRYRFRSKAFATEKSLSFCLVAFSILFWDTFLPINHWNVSILLLHFLGFVNSNNRLNFNNLNIGEPWLKLPNIRSFFIILEDVSIPNSLRDFIWSNSATRRIMPVMKICSFLFSGSRTVCSYRT